MLHSLLPAFNMIIAAMVLAILGYFFRVLRFLDNQMKNNGGSSMRDAVDRIEQRQKKHDKKLTRLERRIDGLESGGDGG
ncbi:MAG: hypothetical protein ACXVXO_11900 [Mycobacteriaceae bacterium]